MQTSCGGRSGRLAGFLRLEALLGIACVSLVVQLCPPSAWSPLDIREWTSGNWFMFNAIVFTMLMMIRFWGEFQHSFASLAHSLRNCRRGAADDPGAKKRMELAEERALYERMKEARSKQVIYYKQQ